MIRVTVWNEFQHERTQEKVKEIYPDGIHTCIAKFLRQEEELSVRTAVFDEKEHGLTEEVLANTDVLVFWNHMLQEEFSDDVAERVRRHVLAGMGLVVLHSGHYSKIMRKLLGTSMTLRWRHGDRESPSAMKFPRSAERTMRSTLCRTICTALRQKNCLSRFLTISRRSAKSRWRS